MEGGKSVKIAREQDSEVSSVFFCLAFLLLAYFAGDGVGLYIAEVMIR